MIFIPEKLSALVAKYAPAEKPAEIVNRKGDEATVYLYDAVAPGDFGGVSAKAFVAALEKAKGANTLRVRINSPGGVIHEAKAIYSAIKGFPGRKIAHVDGLAASAASFIAMAADEIRTAPEATWFVHNAQGLAMGDASAMRDLADVLDMESANIANIYAKRTGMKMEALRKMMDEETFMTAAEAKANGFTDVIEGEEEEPADHAPKAETDAVTKILALRQYTEQIRRKRSGASTGTPGQPEEE